MKKGKIILLSFASILLILILFAVSIHLRYNKIHFTSSFDEIKEKIAKDAGTCSYYDYIKIVQAEYRIVPDKNIIDYSLVMKNITGDKIYINYQVYKEQELIDKYVSSLAPAMPHNKILIELLTGRRAIVTMSSAFLYPYSTFTADDKKHIDELAERLYVEFYKDGKFDYFKVNCKKVDQFSKY